MSKMPLFRRLILAVLSLVVAYTAVFAGDGAGIATYKTSNWENVSPEAIATVATVITAVAGLILWLYAVVWQTMNLDGDKVGTPWLAAGAFVCFAFVFGYFATPFASYGPVPWKWVSRYLVLIFVGFVPMVFVIEAVITDSFKLIWGLLKKKQAP